MCQVHSKFAVLEAGDVQKMFAALQTLPTVNSAIMIDDAIHVIFNHHYCTEEEIRHVIIQSGFSVQTC
jgi:hypothetical protein